MIVLFNEKSNEAMVGYFGNLKFLDNQEEFEKTFGDKPDILHPKTVL